MSLPNNSEVYTRLARCHPVDVAAQRVDLAVVRHHPIRMGKSPRRERVGREALMDEREGCLVTRVQKVAVVRRELANEHHALVDDRARRHRHRIIFRDLRAADRVDAIRHDLADDEESALEIVFGREIGCSADEDLLRHRLDRLHTLAKTGIVDRHVAPADHRLALRRDGLFNDIAHLLPGLAVAWHEELADRVMAGFRKRETKLCAFRCEE